MLQRSRALSLSLEAADWRLHIWYAVVYQWADPVDEQHHQPSQERDVTRLHTSALLSLCTSAAHRFFRGQVLCVLQSTVFTASVDCRCAFAFTSSSLQHTFPPPITLVFALGTIVTNFDQRQRECIRQISWPTRPRLRYWLGQVGNPVIITVWLSDVMSAKADGKRGAKSRGNRQQPRPRGDHAFQHPPTWSSNLTMFQQQVFESRSAELLDANALVLPAKRTCLRSGCWLAELQLQMKILEISRYQHTEQEIAEVSLPLWRRTRCSLIICWQNPLFCEAALEHHGRTWAAEEAVVLTTVQHSQGLQAWLQKERSRREEATRNSRKNTIPPSRSSSPRSYAKPGTQFGAGTSSALSSVTRQRNLNILKLVSNRNSRRYAEDIQGTIVLIGQSVLGEDQNKICSDRNPQNCKNMSCSIDNLEGNHTKQKLDYAVHRRFSETIEFRISTKHQRERSQGQRTNGPNANRRALLCRKCSRDSRNLFLFKTEEGRTEASCKRVASS